MFKRILVTLISIFACGCKSSGPPRETPELLDLTIRLVDPSKKALPNVPIRVVLSSDANSRAPSAGQQAVTDDNGTVNLQLNAKMSRRRITMDSSVSRPADHLAIGVELDLLQRKALYWIELDHVNSGVMGSVQCYVAGSNGNFDEPLVFHDSPPSWTFPDQPEGIHLSGIGVELRDHNLEPRTMPDGTRQWTGMILLEKHQFERR